MLVQRLEGVADRAVERLHLLTSGAGEFFRRLGYVDDWGKAVRDWTGGRGVDVVLEVGGPATMAQSAEAVRIGGHIAMIGGLAGYEGGLPVLAMMMKQARAQGLIVGSRKQQQDFVRAINANGLRPVIDRRFPLERLADAFRYEMTGGHFGKIGVEW